MFITGRHAHLGNAMESLLTTPHDGFSPDEPLQDQRLTNALEAWCLRVAFLPKPVGESATCTHKVILTTSSSKTPAFSGEAYAFPPRSREASKRYPDRAFDTPISLWEAGPGIF